MTIFGYKTDNLVDGDEDTCILEDGLSGLPLVVYSREETWSSMIQVVLWIEDSSDRIRKSADDIEVVYLSNNSANDDIDNQTTMTTSTSLLPSLKSILRTEVTYYLPRPVRGYGVQIRALHNERLSLCEVSIFGGRNLAIRKHVTQGWTSQMNNNKKNNNNNKSSSNKTIINGDSSIISSSNNNIISSNNNNNNNSISDKDNVINVTTTTTTTFTDNTTPTPTIIKNNNSSKNNISSSSNNNNNTINNNNNPSTSANWTVDGNRQGQKEGDYSRTVGPGVGDNSGKVGPGVGDHSGTVGPDVGDHSGTASPGVVGDHFGTVGPDVGDHPGTASPGVGDHSRTVGPDVGDHSGTADPGAGESSQVSRWSVHLGYRVSVWRVRVHSGGPPAKLLDNFALNVTLTDNSEVTVYRRNRNESAANDVTEIILPEPVSATHLTIWRPEAGQRLAAPRKVEAFGECEAGYFGWLCDKGCHCGDPAEVCHPLWGSCPLSHCPSGYKGDNCLDECSPPTYGSNCSRICSSACADHVCHHVTGRCTNGCGAGWKGEECDQECGQGFYGVYCSMTCTSSCLSGACNHVTGMCTNGCQPGREGDKCDRDCKDGWYGANCSRRCSDQCVSATCHSVIGYCLTGCVPGFMGELCDQAVPAEEDSSGDVAGVLIALIILVVIVIIVCLVWYKRRHAGDVEQSIEADSEKDNGHHELMTSHTLRSDDVIDSADVTDDAEKGQGRAGAGHYENHVIFADIETSPPMAKSNDRTTKGLQSTPKPKTRTITPLSPKTPIPTTTTSTSTATLTTPSPRPDATKPQLVTLFSRDAHMDPPELSDDEEDRKVMTTTTTTTAEAKKKATSQNRLTLRINSSENLDIATTVPPRATRDGGGQDTEESPPSTLLSLQELRHKVAQLLEDPGHFSKERAMLPSGKQHDWKAASSPSNLGKNRYKNVLPYDHSRVLLVPLAKDPHSDFYNACYIHGYKKEREYIASQGPMESTVYDFLRMVWDTNCRRIVMLTNTVEMGRFKCQQYWPEEGVLTSDDISVKVLATDVFADYTLRHLSLRRGDEGRQVTMYHYTQWPDKCAPFSPWSLLLFRHNIHQGSTHGEGPIIVHCSAGIGRTGTYVALDILLARASHQQQVDVFQCVLGLRQQRVDMVQTLSQYIFLHVALRAAVLTSLPVPAGEFTLEHLLQGKNGVRPVDQEYERLQMCLGPVQKEGGADGKPHESVSPPCESVSPPCESVSPPCESVSPPCESVSPPCESVSPPCESVSPPCESVSPPCESVSPPCESVSPPCESVSPPCESVSPPCESVSPPCESVSPPCESVSPPCESVSPPCESVSPPCESVSPPCESVSPPCESVSPPCESVSPPCESVSPPCESVSPPWDTHRVNILGVTQETWGSVHINAVSLSSFKQENAYIETHSPQDSGAAIHFLSMLIQYDVTCVVNLDSDQDETFRYWPQSTDEDREFGPYTVGLLSMREAQDLMVRKIRVSFPAKLRMNGTATVEMDSQEVTHVTCVTWSPSRQTPPSVSVILDLVDHITSKGDYPVVVHCRDGYTRSGLVVVAAAILEELRAEDHVAVNYVTAHLRVPRRENIVSVEQYEFLYGCVRAHLHSKRGNDVTTGTNEADNLYGNVDIWMGLTGDRTETVGEESAYGNLTSLSPKEDGQKEDDLGVDWEDLYSNATSLSGTVRDGASSDLGESLYGNV
ncbi:hypothetical protein ACOMHN_025645 [Nucella lapillus]